MRITILKDIFQKFPTYREGILIVENFIQESNSDASYQFLDTVTSSVRLEKEIENTLLNDIWKKTFQAQIDNSGKILPSHVALLSRILETNDLPNINTLTNVINSVQLQKRIPIGAHDLDCMEGDIEVGENYKALQFLPRAQSSSEAVETNEIVHADSKNVLTRKFCYRQGRKDLCSQETNRVVIFLNSLEESDNLEALSKEILSVLKRFSSSNFTAKFQILTKSNPSLDINEIPEFKIPLPIKFKSFPISKNQEIIERILNKSVEGILPTKADLKEMLMSGRRLKVYQGFDPTAPTLHIGHTVMMRKLEDFRKLGHQVFMLIGDFTGRIGDPTDKSSARITLTEKQVIDNLKLYKEQASMLIDINNSENPVTVVFNNDWLGKLSFAQVIDIASDFTVQQMLKRDMFQKRLEEDKPIYLHEFMYPLMQGYDSFALNVDIELGGNDQLFNMLAGRTILQKRARKSKVVVTGKLLTTTEGKKMGKSEGNMITLIDSPENMYGKVMAFSDEQIVSGFELLTNMPLNEVEQIEREIKSGNNPMDLKKKLALMLVTELKGEKEGIKAQEYFEGVYQKQEVNTEIEVFKTKLKNTNLLDLLIETEMSKSKSEARRLIEQGAVYINNVKKVDYKEEVEIDNIILKVGRRVKRITQ
jgi:tyrosyl-tRNA synthetase